MRVSFGPFLLLPSRKLLLRGETPLPLGARAFEILTVLVERAGETVGKEELMARVWPETKVEEGNLRVQVAALRKMLGAGRADDRYVATIPGRGYRFVAPLVTARPSHLPVPLSRVFGRADIVRTLSARLPRQRLVTLVGPGGIGKTTVAVAVARGLADAYRDHARFVDLAPLSDPKLVPSALASVLGGEIVSGQSLAGLIAYLRDREMLLVLDSCEHVIDAVAALAEEVLRSAPGVHILATSRQALRARGEHVQRLAPLPVPSASERLTAEDASAYAAVQLFVERAAASSESEPFALRDDNAAVVAEICRRLDGMALAIELAASRVYTLGVRDLATLLDDRFRLLTLGRRTALPRHRTLGAALDWSYEFLPEAERTVLRQLGVFAGSFTLEAIGAVVRVVGADVRECLASLVAKSLVVADAADAVVRYRLLETMRGYAGDKLTRSEEREPAARRQAEYFRELFSATQKPTVDRVDVYRREIDNVRAALDWAFSATGDEAVGIALTASYAPIWLHLFFVRECRGRVGRALSALDPATARRSRVAFQLNITLGQVLNVDRESDASEEAERALTRALQIAESLEEPDAQLQALWVNQVHRFNKGELRLAGGFAERFLEVARGTGDSFDIGGGHRLIGGVLHYAGDQRGARHHLEQAVELNVAPSTRRHVMWSHYDQHVIAQSRLARVLWLQGLVDRAGEVARQAVASAQARDHQLSTCLALAEAACPIAMMTGDLEGAARSLALLSEIAQRYNFTFWKRLARCLEAKLLIHREEMLAGSSLLRPALEELTGTGLWLYFPGFVGDLARSLAAAGDADGGRAVLEEALGRVGSDGVAWYGAELHRLQGELLPRSAQRADSAAEACFLRSLHVARDQGALSWELRAASSLARLRVRQHRADDARTILEPVYERFTEGFDTPDLRRARALLESETRVHRPPRER